MRLRVEGNSSQLWIAANWSASRESTRKHGRGTTVPAQWLSRPWLVPCRNGNRRHTVQAKSRCVATPKRMPQVRAMGFPFRSSPAGDEAAVFHGPAFKRIANGHEIGDESSHVAARQAGQPAHARAANPPLANVPSARDLMRPIVRSLQAQAGIAKPRFIVGRGAKRRAKEVFANGAHLFPRCRGLRPIAGQPRTYGDAPARLEPAGRPLEKGRFVEEVLGALDAPNHIKGAGGEFCLLGILARKARLPANAAEPGRERGPGALHGAQR